MKKQLLLGLMAMTLPWTAWADGLTVTIKDATNVVYNGDKTTDGLEITVTNEEGTQLVENTDYKVYLPTGPFKAGQAYTVTVKGLDGGDSDYLGQTGSTTFTVTPKEVKKTFTFDGIGENGVSKTYGESDQVVLKQLIKKTDVQAELIDNSDDEYENFLACLEVAREKDQSDVVNKEGYTIFVKGKEGAESNYKYVTPTTATYTTLYINPAELTATITEQATYNGFNLGLTYYATNKKYEITGIVGKDEVSISDFTCTEAVKDAKKYTLEAVLDGKDKGNYTISSVEFVVKPATLTITQTEGTESNFKIDFDGKTVEGDLTNYFTYTTFKGSDESDIKGNVLTMRWSATTTDAGKHKVLPYVGKTPWNAETNPLQNYDIVYEKEVEFVINPKTIESNWISIETKDLTYQGKLFDASGKIVVKYTNSDKKEVTLVEGTDYENVTTVPAAGSDRNGIDAKTKFTVKIDGKGNYAGTEVVSGEFEITKAPLTITAKTGDDVKWSKEYTAVEYQDVLTNQFDYADFKENDNAASIGLSMKKQYTNPSVGNYNVLVYNGKDLYDEKGNPFTNYEIKYETVAKFEITPATLKYSIASIDDAVYNGTEQKFTFTTVEAVEGFGFKGNDTWKNIARTDMEKVVAPIIEVEDGDTKNAGEHKLILKNEEEVSAGPNYTVEYVEANAKLTIAPSTVTITISNKTVDFKKFAEELSEDKLADLAQNTDFTKIDNNPKSDNIGRKALRDMITLELKNGAETGASGVYENGIVATIKAVTEDDQTMLNNYGYGLMDEEGNPTHFIIKNGTLTIGNVAEPLVLDGAEDADAMLAENPDAETIPVTLARLNGATVESVTIKNLKNITPVHGTLYTDMWYSLVLPFEVTVREISEVFGYAIVDIPDTNNTDPDVISFKLTLGTVPANTMMLFKVDEQQNWEGKEWTFKKAKTIVYNPEAEPVHDAANNYFMPVYNITKLDEESQWYMYYNGKPYNALKNPMTMYPLNGYINAVSGAAARIIVEEADGSTTAINAVNADNVNAAEGWYSVDGMKLNAQPTQKGIYINNGKKVVIK